jgi:hypothetical protein
LEQAAHISAAKTKRLQRIGSSLAACAASQTLRRKSRRASAAIALALACAASPAAAHPEFNPTRTTRYLKASLLGGGAVRIAYTVMIGELPALAVRRAMDDNHDGRLDPGEQKRWAEALAARVDQALTVELDGARVHPRWEVPVAGGLEAGKVEPVPFSVDLVARLDAGRGVHTVKLDDATELDQLGESELRIEEGPGARLLAAWQGREDSGKQTRFVWNGPRFSVVEDRSVGFRFDDGAAPPHPRRRAYPIALIGAPLGLLIAAVMMARARRRRS